MKILAIESSAGVASVALCEDKKLLYLVQDDSGNTHSTTLLPMVIKALERHRLQVADLDLVGVSVGPGSYTGVRIGTATVKGLCAGRGIPCVGVSSLEALAASASLVQGIICPVIDARRGRMYTALFENKNGKLSRITEDEVLTFAEIDKRLKTLDRVTYLVGSGYELCKRALQFKKIKDTPGAWHLENAYGVAQSAYRAYLEEPGRLITEEQLSPMYILKTQAEREREERLEKEKASK